MVKLIILTVTFLFVSQFLIYAQEEPPVFNQRQIIPTQKRTAVYSQQSKLKNISIAIETAKKVLNYSNFGKIWLNTAPMGEKEIKAAIIYNNVVIGVVRFSPLNGEILPEGYHEKIYNTDFDINSIKEKIEQIKNNLKVLNGVEYRDPESCFAIPVVYNEKIVFKIKIYYDGVHVVPDYPAMEEIKIK